MKEILIVGAGGLGKEVADLINDMGGYEIIGFIDDDIKKIGTVINKITVVDILDNIQKYKSVKNIVIAIANPFIKDKIYKKIRDMGFEFPNLIHPTVITGSNVSMGIGNIVFTYSILSTDVTIANFVTINHQCGVGHDSEIESFTTLYWNVNLAGATKIGERCELGTKTSVIQGINIVDEVIVGSGAVVIRDIKESCTVVGVPAKRIDKGE